MGWFCAIVSFGLVNFNFKLWSVSLYHHRPPLACQSWETWVPSYCSHFDPREVQKITEN